MRNTPIWTGPISHIARHRPDTAQIYFSPCVLQATARRFVSGFDGLVTYAVKANAGDEVLTNLLSAGITAFDVASPREMYAVRALSPNAVLHYNNPVRSPDEIEVAIALGIRSFSVDCERELVKLSGVSNDSEITVRLALPVPGAHYDFGKKFGTNPDRAVKLLQQVVGMGLTPSITFHPGTQCADPRAWGAYLAAAADVAGRADVRLSRLNVGGGFAAHRSGQAPDIEAIFTHIRAQVDANFGPDAPALVCEPGRAMVAEAFTIATRVKALRFDGSVFLNDGVYGGLFEARDMPMGDRITVVSPSGEARQATPTSHVVFGPTCDSLDRLPDPLDLPSDLVEGDYLLFAGMGAYSRSLSTSFNGYGLGDPVTVAAL